MLFLLWFVAALVIVDLVAGVVLWRRFEERFAKLERVGILVTPDPKLKDAPVAQRMSRRQKIRYIEKKLRQKAGGEP